MPDIHALCIAAVAEYDRPGSTLTGLWDKAKDEWASKWVPAGCDNWSTVQEGLAAAWVRAHPFKTPHR